MKKQKYDCVVSLQLPFLLFPYMFLKLNGNTPKIIFLYYIDASVLLENNQ